MIARRIALIHATPVAMRPVHDAFAACWPEAEPVDLLESSLSSDRAAAGSLTEELTERLCDLADYAERRVGAAGILFTCSAFGPAIEQCARRASIPVLKPNEAMFEAALAQGGRLGLLATFAPSIPSMAAEFEEMR
ncbi:MAG TPA: aspartate/glutamate racemase family protein, partial [Kiloniellaceae bacterium]